MGLSGDRLLNYVGFKIEIFESFLKFNNIINLFKFNYKILLIF